MKKYIIIIAICLFSGLGYAQKVKEYNSYAEAMKEFRVTSEDKKIMMIYFFDGENSQLQRQIKKNILKPDVLKQFGKDVVLLKIDASKEPKQNAYNHRPLTAYNFNKVFPSIKVYIPGQNIALPLQTSFKDKEVASFITTIKSL